MCNILERLKLNISYFMGQMYYIIYCYKRMYPKHKQMRPCPSEDSNHIYYL